MKRRRKRRYWTDKEIQYLRDNYATTPTSVIARHLRRRPSNVSTKACALGITKYERRLYSPEEIAYLTRNSTTYPTAVIARHLGRSADSIYQMIYRLGLPTFKKNHAEFRDSLYPDILRMVMDGATNSQIADRFHLTKSQVDGYLHHHNIIRKNFQ